MELGATVQRGVTEEVSHTGLKPGKANTSDLEFRDRQIIDGPFIPLPIKIKYSCKGRKDNS